jgi:predicted DNA-binding protein (UPF0251 family)
VQRAHALEDGGGRELAYVKMSRAKERSTVYVAADSPEQALDDLRRSWAHSRRIGWAIDRAEMDHDPPAVSAAKAADGTVPAALRHARLVAEREALARVIPTDPAFAHSNAEARVRRLELELDNLERAEGSGVWAQTPVGDAAIAWRRAVSEQRSCLARSEHAGFRERRQLCRRAERAAEREGPLREAFERLAAPERGRLKAELPEARKLMRELQGQFAAHCHFQVAHPEALRRLDHLDLEIEYAAYEMDIERAGVDGIVAERPQLPDPARGLEHDSRLLDRGIDLGR